MNNVADNPEYEPIRKQLSDQLMGDARTDNKPFCYWWGPTNTHRTWERGSAKNLWDLEPDDLKGRLPDFLPDVHEIREDVCDYLGECLAVDAGLGVLMQRLEEIGELDNTLIVVSGDHGIPGFPRAKCNLYDIGCEVALAARLPGNIPAGRTVDDFVNIMDLAPTFLDVAGVDIPDSMTGKSLLPVLQSKESGQVDPSRTFVVTGRERHVATAREGCLPYPQRAIRTNEFLYIHNFAPDRWPTGDPQGLDDPTAEAPSYEELANTTYVAYPDLDASPTKAWMVHHRAEENVQTAFDLGFKDPHYMNNIADDPNYESTRKELSDQLMQLLREQNDPRIVETPCRFESAPFAGSLPE